MAQFLKSTAVKILRFPGVLTLLERLERQSVETLRVLHYHRLGPPDEANDALDPTQRCASPEEFAAMMRFAADRYRVIGVRQLVKALTGGPALPRRALLLTFDDGYRDFAEYAWPVLRELGLPALLFVPTAFPPDPARALWWDAVYQMINRTKAEELHLDGMGRLGLDGGAARTEAVRQIVEHFTECSDDERMAGLQHLERKLGVTPRGEDAVLSWDDLRRLGGEGLDIAPHSHTHPILARLDEVKMLEEVRTSQRLIKEQLGQEHPVFCYPNGEEGTFSPVTRRVLTQCGIIAAFTTIWGVNTIGRTDALELHRIGVGLHMDTHRLRFQLTLPPGLR